MSQILEFDSHYWVYLDHIFGATYLAMREIEKPDPGNDYRLGYLLRHQSLHVACNAIADILKICLKKAFGRAVSIAARDASGVRCFSNETGSRWAGASASGSEFGICRIGDD